jgi:hypothetical protein
MDNQFFCSECRSEHNEPADARLGHLVICLECALRREVCAFEIELATLPIPIAA